MDKLIKIFAGQSKTEEPIKGNQIKQIEAKGKLIVLPFMGTLDDFVKQLKEGTNGIGVETISLKSIGLHLQESYNKAEQVKFCCLGDLNSTQRLKKLKITREDLGTIYIEGHGNINENKRKGHARVFNGPCVYADEIAAGLGNLFKHCGYKPNETVDSKIIIGCCYGAAKKDKNRHDVLSIAKAIEMEFKKRQFKLEPGNPKGTEGPSYTVPSRDYKKVLLLSDIPSDETLRENLLPLHGNHTVRNYSMAHLPFANNVNVFSNITLLRNIFEKQFETNFKQVYENNKVDITKILTWLKNVAVDYAKLENVIGADVLTKLNKVPKKVHPHENGTFAEEEKELRELNLIFKKFINLCKICEFSRSKSDVFKNIKSYDDLASEIQLLKDKIQGCKNNCANKKKTTRLELEKFGLKFRELIELSKIEDFKDIQINDFDLNSKLKLFEKNLQDYLDRNENVMEIVNSYNAFINTYKELASEHDKKKEILPRLTELKKLYDDLFDLIDWQMKLDDRYDREVNQQVKEFEKPLKVLNDYENLILKTKQLHKVGAFNKDEVDEILKNLRDETFILNKIDQTVKVEIYDALGVTELLKQPKNGLTRQWTSKEMQEAIEQIFKNADQSLILKAKGEKDDEYPEDDNKKLLNTVETNASTVITVPKQEPPSMNPNSKTELGPNIGSSTSSIQPTEPKVKPLAPVELPNRDPGKPKGCTLEEILASSKNLTEALRKANSQASLSDQKLSKEQLNGLVKIATEKLQSISQQDRDQVDELALEVICELLQDSLLSLDADLISQSYISAKETLEEIQKETIHSQPDQEIEYGNNGRLTM